MPTQNGRPATRVGAFLSESSYDGASTWAAAHAEWQSITGIPLPVTRWYKAAGDFSFDSTLTGMVAAGVRICLSLRPAFNPVSPADAASIATLLSALQAAGADVEVALWHEPAFDGLSASQYAAMMQFYSPTVRQYYPLWCVFSGLTDTVQANGYFPGPSFVDGIAVDAYAQSPGITQLNNCQTMADNNGLPLAIWEFNGGTDLGMPTVVNGQSQAAVTAYFQAVQALFAARVATGKGNGNILFFSSPGGDGTANFLGTALSQSGGFEGGIAHWTGAGGCTIAPTTARSHSGSGSLAMTATGTSTMDASMCSTALASLSGNALAVTAGQTVAGTEWFRAATAGRSCQAVIRTYNASGVQQSSTSGTAVTDTTTGQVQGQVSATVPATAIYAVLFAQVDSPGGPGEVHYVDDPQISVVPAPNDLTSPIQYPWDFRIPLLAAMQSALDDTEVVTVLAAAPALTASGGVARAAQATLSASPALSASAAASVINANATLAVTANNTARAAAPLAAAASLTAATSASAAHMSAGAIFVVPGRLGSAALAAGTSLTVAGSYFAPGAASLSAAAGLQAISRVTDEARAALSAGAVLSPAALAIQRPSAHLAAGASLMADAIGPTSHLAAGASLTAGAVVGEMAAVSLHSAASLAAAGRRTVHSASALSSAARLTSGAVVLRRAAALLMAGPSLRAAGTRLPEGTAHLSASAALGAHGTRWAAGTGHLTAAPVLTAGGATSSGARMHASASLSAAAKVARAGKAALSARSSLAAAAKGTALPGITLSSAAALSAKPLGIAASRAALSSLPVLAISPETRPGTPLPIRPARAQGTWQRDVQRFAIRQERQRHAQAVWQYGELMAFALMWRPEDIGLGLAQRCTRCFAPQEVIAENPAQPDSGASVQAQISAAYGQGAQYRCPLCYGTQLIAAAPAGVPGVRAILVRPAILTDTDQNQQRSAKGVVNTGSVQIQSTPDFRVSTLDYAFRADGRRYQLAVPARTTLRTGFGSPWQQSAAISYNLANATLEDPKASVAYLIPPSREQLESALGVYTRIPADYAWLEQVNGPLIPGEEPPPAASGLFQPSASLGGA